ncbi:hypothetical protein LXL04_033559 [Taraxacum kok-saghyz]
MRFFNVLGMDHVLELCIWLLLSIAFSERLLTKTNKSWSPIGTGQEKNLNPHDLWNYFYKYRPQTLLFSSPSSLLLVSTISPAARPPLDVASSSRRLLLQIVACCNRRSRGRRVLQIDTDASAPNQP